MSIQTLKKYYFTDILPQMEDASRRRQEDWERSLESWKAKHGKEDNKVSSMMIDHTSINRHHAKKDSSFFTKFLIFLAFAIPITILGYALYINYLPLGYEKTYTLTIDEQGIVSPLSNEIYLTNSQGRKLLSLPEGVNGQVNLVFSPNVVLKNAMLDVSIEGEGMYLATPLNISEIDWEHDWDFTEGIPENGAFEGTAQFNQEQQCVHFNAYNEQALSLLNSKDMFESDAMSIYVKWKPSSTSQLLGDNQQILGHFNWELWQNERSVRFQVGRMNDSNGTFYAINYPITSDFFNKEHEALAVYSPDSEGNGYIELWIDSNFAGRVSIGADSIYRDYNGNRDLSLGWSPHNFGNNPYFDGCVYNAKIINEVIKQETTELQMSDVSGKVIVPIIGNGKLDSAILTMRK